MDMTACDLSHRDCARFHELLGRVGDRWTLRVAVALSREPLRFNQIRRAVAGISQQMLTRTLKALERDGMVSRTVHPSVPPQVEYALTALGQSLVAEGLRLGAWAEEHLSEIDLSRARYDRAEGTT